MAQEKLPKSPFPHWAAFMLVSGFRKRRLEPHKTIAAAGINEGQIVLELGCGPGFFTEYIAETVGPSGKVVSQDIQRQMLAKLKKRMAHFPVSNNIEILLANSSDLGLSANSIDVVFAANVFEEVAKEGEMAGTAGELLRVLKPQGHIFFGEHRLPDSLLKSILAELEKAGLKAAETDRGGFYYAAILKKDSREKI